MKLKIIRNGKLASEITIVQCDEDYEIKYIRTATDQRGKGYASKLLKKAKVKFPCLVAFLDDDGTGLTVEQMQSWYERHGFKKCRYNLGKVWDRNIKTVMMWGS